jgi:glutamate decarboxylase
MPKDIEDMVVMRIVIRQGMSRDMADMLIQDINDSVIELEKIKYPTTSRLEAQKNGKVFTH